MTAAFFVGTLLHAQSFPTDSSALERPDWGHIQDSLDIRQAELRLFGADLLVEHTDVWHRLLPRITLAASYGIRGVTFIDAADPVFVAMPTDQYRLTLSLSVSDLLSSYEHERAQIMREQAHLALSLAQTKEFMDGQILAERAKRLRAELSLLEEELLLTERILRYHALLFEQGKTSFDVYMRAELQVLEVRQKVQRLRSELGENSIN